MDFNYQFQRTLNRILVSVKPSNDYAFLFYLKALNSDIALMIQSMGGNTLPVAFDVAVRAENSLIQVGKIAPRPPMPIFADLQPIIPIVPPVIVVVPSFPTYNAQVVAQEHVVPSHLQEIISSKEQNANLQKTLQNSSNELVNINKAQTQPPYQILFQAPYQASYQPNFQGQRRNFNQRPF